MIWEFYFTRLAVKQGEFVAEQLTHVWRWRCRLPERFGERCRVLAYGRMNSVLV